MRVLQAHHEEFVTLLPTVENKILLVETQPYGQIADFRYHFVCNNQTADFLINTYLLREIDDTGRSIGFWQNFGGKGIFRPDLSQLHGFSQEVLKIHKVCKEGKYSFNGATWKEIIAITPLPIPMKKAIGFYE